MSAAPIEDGQGRFADLLAAIGAFAGSRLYGAVCMIAAAALLEGAGLVLLLPLAETIFAQDGTAQSGVTGRLIEALAAAGVETVIGQLAVLGGAFVLLVALRAWVMLKRDVLMADLSQGFVDHIRRDFFGQLAQADWPVIKRFRKSQLLNSMTINIGRLEVTLHYLSLIVVTLAIGLAYLVAAFVISSLLGLVLLALCGAGLVSAVIWTRRSHRLGERLNLANRGVMDETTRFLDGMKAAKAARAEAELTARFASSIAETRAIAVQFVNQQARLHNSVQLGAAVAALLVLLIGYGVIGLSGGELVVMAAIVLRLAPNLISVFGGLQSIAHAMPAFQSIRALQSQLEAAQPDSESAKDDAALAMPPAANAPLLIDHARVAVADAQGQGATLVETGRLEIAPGSLVHISGPSGAGKSTLAELVAGLHLPASGSVGRGEVRLDGESRKAWQSQVSFAPQEPFIFDGTVRENLLWPNLVVPDSAIWEVLAQVEIAAIVRALPRSLDEQLLDGGARLSGGERQRLCLARALLRPASLLILDEATSAMDPELERLIISRISQSIGDRIVLMVSHSLNAAGFADMRVVVADGRAQLTEDA